jgi:hypothetical protein
MAVDYLAAYVRRYRQEYLRFTSPPPAGGGFPKLRISPYLDSSHLDCYLAEDGAVIADFSWAPEYSWEIAGGPALLVDLPDTRVPDWWVQMLKSRGIYGSNIGISRITAKEIPDEIWGGKLPDPIEASSVEEGSTTIQVRSYPLSWIALIQRLTFGALGLILDLKLPQETIEFWTPRIVRDLGFVTADRQNKRFFHYLELLRHVTNAAWDPRSVWARVHVDVRRDFSHTVRTSGQFGGYISFEAPEAVVWDYSVGTPAGEASKLRDRLDGWNEAVDSFDDLLREHGEADEAVFQSFLEANPAVLDLYGTVHPKPQFRYPEGEASAAGKTYVEPDFLIAFSDRSYRLVELEKPDKRLATVAGQPRAELTQAVFQIGEFRDYIAKHYAVLANRFPGISSRCSFAVVISRNTERSLGVDRNKDDYLDLVRGMFADIDIWVYDDLLARGRQALMNLSRLSSEA